MKTCFVSAPVTVDLSVLKSALEAEGIKPILPFELDIRGANFREQIEKAIKKATLFIAVISSDAENLNVLFELGYASASRKRIAVIQDRDFELPPNISGFPVVKCKIDDENELRAFLKQFSRQQKSSATRSSELAKTRPLSGRAKQMVAHLKALGQRATEKELESVLVDALRESGIRVIAESSARDKGYDFALWIDELEYPIGNPVLVELKSNLKLPTARALRTNFLAQRETAVGKALLVVYLSGPPDSDLRHLQTGAPLVLFVSASRLLSALEDHSLAQFVRTERNKLAHGV
ncbi:MAG: TIR domain-containing protein [Chthoniobacterales bacterium]|nr:TIR domain-containing protein [Chthoniobacterales bacterium]